MQVINISMADKHDNILLGVDELGFAVIIQLSPKGKIVATFKTTAYAGCPF